MRTSSPWARCFAAVLVPFLSSCCAPDLSGVPLVIDINASVFNATDLPIRGIASRVRDLPGPVADLLGKVARRGGVGAQAEAIALRRELIARRRWDADADESRFVALRQRAEFGQRGPSVHEDPLLDELMRDPVAARVVATRLGVNREFGLSDLTTVLPEATASRIAATLEEYAPDTLGWIRQLLPSRWEAARRLGRDFPDVDLFTPALIDAGQWLGDVEHVPVATQILLAEWVMRAMEGRVHFFAPFDPLAAHRSALAGGDSYFVTVADAVMQRGFVGFSIRPGLGFYPHDNPGRPRERAALRKEEWEGVDRQLERLYSFCAVNEIPLMTDATADLSPSPAAVGCAAPAEWQEVLLRHLDPPLHLLFAGGADGRLDSARDAVQVMRAGVFADLGGGAALDSAAARGRVAARVNAMCATRPFESHLLYGSRGSLLRQEWSDRCALRDLTLLFAEDRLLKVEKQGLFANNPMTYLFLKGQGAGRDRLERFYARHGIPAASVRWLNAVQGMESLVVIDPSTEGR